MKVLVVLYKVIESYSLIRSRENKVVRWTWEIKKSKVQFKAAVTYFYLYSTMKTTQFYFLVVCLINYSDALRLAKFRPDVKQPSYLTSDSTEQISTTIGAPASGQSEEVKVGIKPVHLEKIEEHSLEIKEVEVESKVLANSLKLNLTNLQTNSTPFLEWPYYGYETLSDPFAAKKIEEWKSRYPNECGAKEVYCSKDKVCISEEVVCDGCTDCSDREDERNCHP